MACNRKPYPKEPARRPAPAWWPCRLLLILAVAWTGLIDTPVLADTARSDDVAIVDKLMWQKYAQPNRMQWEGASGYCAGLDLGGHQDWRLPSIDELRSIIRDCPKTQSGGVCGVTDACTHFATCDSRACSGCARSVPSPGDCYWKGDLKGRCALFWSSTRVEDIDEYAWRVHFYPGHVRGFHTDDEAFVRCARSMP